MLRTLGAVSGRGALAVLLLLLGGCANSERTPGVPWIAGATALSMAGMPPRRPDFYEAPVRVSETLKFTAITAGADHTCGIEIGGDTYCWGSNLYQQLGSAVPAETCASGRLSCSSAPVRIEGAPRFTALAASLWGTCGLDAAGGAHCWGYGLGGPQGGSVPASSGVPVEVPGGHEFVELASSPAAGHGTCGLTATGDAWCWSVGAGGGGAQSFAGPDRIAMSSKLVSIGPGGSHGCGIDETLDAFCWGNNQVGQLGVGSSGTNGGLRESAVPVAVQGGLKFNGIVVAAAYSCGLNTEGSLYCWGQSFDAPVLASRRVPDRRSIRHESLPVPFETAGPKWVAMGAATAQVCALSADGEIYCFATMPTRRGDGPPARIESDATFVSFAVGGHHLCAIGADAFAYCWGLNQAAQAGRPPTGRPVRR